MTEVRYQPRYFVDPASPVKFGHSHPRLKAMWWIPGIKQGMAKETQLRYLRGAVVQHCLARTFRDWLPYSEYPDVKTWWESHQKVITKDRLYGILSGRDLMKIEDIGWMLDKTIDIKGSNQGIARTNWVNIGNEVRRAAKSAGFPEGFEDTAPTEK